MCIRIYPHPFKHRILTAYICTRLYLHSINIGNSHCILGSTCIPLNIGNSMCILGSTYISLNIGNLLFVLVFTQIWTRIMWLHVMNWEKMSVLALHLIYEFYLEFYNYLEINEHSMYEFFQVTNNYHRCNSDLLYIKASK